ncbi:subtilisin-like protein [Myriangium duriaei CBS 260.36]|uniref:Subtilisin-like protein n=1 Tax=Myriangium duriaei CBS 260.36 TaxID=1168546 RepID=A0A9P4J2E9_9PEZI|nr:subtilisin-like protein [Myriangium duriaei CBS 260.36]
MLITTLCLSLTTGLLLITEAQSTPSATANAGLDIVDKYIISLKRGVDLNKHINRVHFQQQRLGKERNQTTFAGVTRKLSIGNFHVYTGHFHTSVVKQLKDDHDIESIEADSIWHEEGSGETPCGDSCATGSNNEVIDHDSSDHRNVQDSELQKRGLVYQTCANFNLRLISHRGADPKWTYWYDQSSGAGTWAYVVDGGVNSRHSDFGTRARLGYNAWGLGTTDQDTTGHGTHTAAIIGGKKNGVAKKCNIIASKVTKDGQTTTEILLDGYKWAASDVINRHRQAKAVINVSVYSRSVSEAFAKMVTAAYNRGVVTVVAAGNGGEDARYTSPASARDAITVGATDRRRARTADSNFGPGVDIWAPGQDICSAALQGGRATSKRSGTSQAAAHVSGLIVYMKGFQDLGDARSTRLRLNSLATMGVVGNPKGGKNLFAYNGSGK